MHHCTCQMTKQLSKSECFYTWNSVNCDTCAFCVVHNSTKNTNACLSLKRLLILCHHHHISVMELGHLLTCSGLTCPEVSSKVCEPCQWLKFPLNVLRAQSRVSQFVGLLTLASEAACLGMAFPPFLVKQLIPLKLSRHVLVCENRV
jgi:hypothetical protein